nr:putative reverse transcriptase domain-containing protein [Tanacetum cinerariifolium]
MKKREDESLYFIDCIWVSLVGGVKTIIMDEAHKTRYSVHPGADKMYHDLRDMYWWLGMKRDITIYVSKCLTCFKLKAEHQRPLGLLQQPEIPEWKWDKITMDFITKLPRSKSEHDLIWVIVDILTKSAHFLATREDYSIDKLARLYIDEIVARHGVPVLIILDRDRRVTSHCWKIGQKTLETRLDMSTTYHPQTDEQSERMIQTLKDMLRAGVIDFGGNLDVHLPLAEFSNNNSYHSSIRCALFEALYGRKCRPLVLWAEIRESSLIGPELVQETTDKVVLIKEKLKAVRDCQKSYTDNRCKPLEFEVKDRVLLKVSPWEGMIRFRKKGKLAPRYVGPFDIFERIIPVDYWLRMPEELSSVHDTFHVSNLKKCLTDANLQVKVEHQRLSGLLVQAKIPQWKWDNITMDFITKLPKSSQGGLLAGIYGPFSGRICGLSQEGYLRWKDLWTKLGGLFAGIYGLFSRRYGGLVRRVTCGYPWPGLGETTRTLSNWCLGLNGLKLGKLKLGLGFGFGFKEEPGIWFEGLLSILVIEGKLGLLGFIFEEKNISREDCVINYIEGLCKIWRNKE